VLLEDRAKQSHELIAAEKFDYKFIDTIRSKCRGSRDMRLKGIYSRIKRKDIIADQNEDNYARGSNVADDHLQW
jgi:hypothetical protein